MAIATTELKRPSRLVEFWTYFRENRGAVIGLWIVTAFVLVAIFANFLAPYSPTLQMREYILMPPAWQEGGDWAFPLGTDPVGRDILSRLIYGARYSFFVGVVVVVVAVSGGVLMGLIAGFSPRWLDGIIMRVMDIILAFPSLLLALVLVAVLGPSLINAMIAIALVLQPHYVRLTRASVINERTKDYVISARVAGARWPRLMFVTVLPNCLAPIIVQATIEIAVAILAEAALSYLGLGAQPPAPSWGRMLSEAQTLLYLAPGLAIWPGLAIVVAVLGFGLLGDGLRDVTDPRLRRAR